MLAKLYQEDVERHRLIQKKAEYTQNSLLVVCQIFKELLALDVFVELLKDENLASLPQPLLASTKSGSPL